MLIFDDLLTEVMQNTEMQKKIYSIGGLIGNGVKAGIGLQKGSGKFKLEDLVLGVASTFLQGKFGVGLGQPQQQQQTESQDGQSPIGVFR